jgi:beta-glucosidase
MTPDTFPANFYWGAATASYQIEGAVDQGGRSESIWDRFCTVPGKVRNGESGAIACGHYHRVNEDVALLRELGVNAYRFSTAWPRILPDGRGRVNQTGLDFYDHLVDELLENGIEPFVTLYHWDMPQVLEDAGGWPERATVDAFAEYAEVVARRLGDRVSNWITHNEPWVAAWLGYGWGTHAPGRTSQSDALAAAHHLMLSHGRAVHVIRGIVPSAQVGITLNLIPVYPASQSEADLAAAAEVDGHQNRWFLDPIFRGEYPADRLRENHHLMPAIGPNDLAEISTPIDFLGINNYSRSVVRADANGHPAYVRQDGSRYTDMDWEVYPQGLQDLLVRVHRDYAPGRLYVTENGAAFTDTRDHNGAVLDPERTQYIVGHLDAEAGAIAQGVPLAGHFVWSLLDNFEWQQGYGMRFGLVFVDYPTLERVPKGSYFAYRDYITAASSQDMSVPA